MNKEQRRHEWEQRMAEYEISEQGAVVWCASQSIKLYQFYYWRKKFRAGQVEKKGPVKWVSLALDFKPVTDCAAAGITVQIGCGVIRAYLTSAAPSGGDIPDEWDSLRNPQRDLRSHLSDILT